MSTEINASMVKSLRDRTGAGMMDCKQALVEASGDEETAVELIQKKGLAKAAKRAGAIATEGVVHAYIHPGGRLGVLVEINCQTDFVARNDDFLALVDDVGLQIASMSPSYVSRDLVPEEVQQKQRRLFIEQIEEESQRTGKKTPAQAVDKIVDGKLHKWLSESCLIEQISVRDGESTIEQLCQQVSAKLGEKVAVRRFVRYELGEGIAVAKKDFAAEVAETLKQ